MTSYRKLKELGRRADLARGEEREELVEILIRELPRLDPFKGFSEGAIRLARLLARLKWFRAESFS